MSFDGRKLIEEVRENRAKLTRCAAHTFAPNGPENLLGTRYVCGACGGAVDAHARHWYELGLKHGKTQ